MQHHQQRITRYPGHVHVLHEQPHPANLAMPAKEEYRRGNTLLSLATVANV